MASEKLFNILEGFNFDNLENPEFQEDSVREELIIPIIRGLGYSADKPNQIIRSRKLIHPFVSIGSKRKNIYLIPDYLFEVNGKNAWILDAKSPNEEIIKSKHVEQAYSYAIHSEVRVNFFALCNGKEFVLYDIQKPEPLLHFPLSSIPRFWEPLKSLLAPNKVFREDYNKLAKDLGLHLKRLGFGDFRNLIFPGIPITEITQLDPNQFSFSGGLIVGNETYMATFDFDENVFKQLKDIIPDEAFNMLSIRRENERLSSRFSDMNYLVTIDCKIGQNLEENEREIFLPMSVNRFIKIKGSN